MNEARRNIYLIGMMGTGKSTVGKLVASHIKMDFIDSDSAIEERTGLSVSEIFSTHGEEGFREMEKEFISNGHPLKNCLISCGGGLCMNKGVWTEMKSKGLIVCLWAEKETIYDRVKNDTNRPLLQVKKPIHEIGKIINQRKDTYLRADLVIKTDNLMAEEVASKIVNASDSMTKSKTKT